MLWTPETSGHRPTESRSEANPRFRGGSLGIRNCNQRRERRYKPCVQQAFNAFFFALSPQIPVLSPQNPSESSRGWMDGNDAGSLGHEIHDAATHRRAALLPFSKIAETLDDPDPEGHF